MHSHRVVTCQVPGFHVDHATLGDLPGWKTAVLFNDLLVTMLGTLGSDIIVSVIYQELTSLVLCEECT